MINRIPGLFILSLYLLVLQTPVYGQSDISGKDTATSFPLSDSMISLRDLDFIVKAIRMANEDFSAHVRTVSFPSMYEPSGNEYRLLNAAYSPVSKRWIRSVCQMENVDVHVLDNMNYKEMAKKYPLLSEQEYFLGVLIYQILSRDFSNHHFKSDPVHFY